MEKKLLNTVLVVEDNVYYQQMVALMIKPHARQVLCFKNAEEAMEFLDAASPDLIIADFYLEGMMTGGDLLRHCKENHPQTEFIFMSSDKRVSYLLDDPEFENVTFIEKNKQALGELEKDLFLVLRKENEKRNEKYTKILYSWAAVIVFVMIGIQLVTNMMTNK